MTNTITTTETFNTTALRVARVACTDARVALRAAEDAFDAARDRLSSDDAFAAYDRLGHVREALARLNAAMVADNAAHDAYQRASSAVFAELTR